jgi:F0F1-type ATP synthase delta subunit
MTEFQIIQMIRQGKNPQELVLQFLKERASGTPFGENLIYLAENNRTQDIEQIARNLAQARGIDYDKEFNAFKQRLGL